MEIILRNELWILKFKQTDVLQSFTSHWGILLKYDDFGTLYHLAASGNGSPFYTTETRPIDRWESAKTLRASYLVGVTDLLPLDIDNVCRELSRTFKYHMYNNNCQDFAKKCLKKLGFTCDHFTMHEVCECKNIVTISSPRGVRRCSVT